MTEREIQTMMVNGSRRDNNGWRIFKINDGTTGRKPMDISGMGPGGRAVCCEVKSIDGSLNGERPLPFSEFSATQQTWLRAYAETGAIAIMAIHDPEARIVRCFYGREISLWSKEIQQQYYWQFDLHKDGETYRGWREHI